MCWSAPVPPLGCCSPWTVAGLMPLCVQTGGSACAGGLPFGVQAWCDALRGDAAFANWKNDQQALNELVPRGVRLPPPTADNSSQVPGLQPHASQAATACRPVCIRMHPKLQPYAFQAAAVCIPACHRMYPRRSSWRCMMAAYVWVCYPPTSGPPATSSSYSGRHHAPRTTHHAPCTVHHAPCTRHQAPGTVHDAHARLHTRPCTVPTHRAHAPCTVHARRTCSGSLRSPCTSPSRTATRAASDTASGR